MRHYLKSTFQSRKPYTQRRNEQKTSNAQKKLIHMTILSAFPDPQFYPPFLGQNAAWTYRTCGLKGLKKINTSLRVIKTSLESN